MEVVVILSAAKDLSCLASPASPSVPTAAEVLNLTLRTLRLCAALAH